MTSEVVEPISKSLVVNAGIERAFALFIERFDAIKPREHNLLEPTVGGHIYDVGTDDRRCQWARVLAYEPPRRIVCSWDIGPAWQLQTDPARASEVEVRFIPERAERARVKLEHRHIERHGAGRQSVADGVGSDAGWPLYLDRYRELVTQDTRR